MKNTTVCEVIEIKKNGKWQFFDKRTDELTVYEKLAQDLIAKKINKCTYIRSITRKQLYNGYITITVVYSASGSTTPVRSIYTIKSTNC